MVKQVHVGVLPGNHEVLALTAPPSPIVLSTWTVGQYCGRSLPQELEVSLLVMLNSNCPDLVHLKLVGFTAGVGGLGGVSHPLQILVDLLLQPEISR